MKPINESQIQQQICAYLSLIAHKTGIVYFSVPNESLMMVLKTFKVPEIACYAIVAYFKKIGMLSGVNDLVIIHKGMYYGLEVKTAKGKQKPEQKLFERNILKAGGKYEIVRSLEDAERQIREWGIL